MKPFVPNRGYIHSRFNCQNAIHRRFVIHRNSELIQPITARASSKSLGKKEGVRTTPYLFHCPPVSNPTAACRSYEIPSPLGKYSGFRNHEITPSTGPLMCSQKGLFGFRVALVFDHSVLCKQRTGSRMFKAIPNPIP